jgi:hypothetical protein
MPKWGIHVSIDQLGHPAASLRDVVQLAKAFNRDAALVILGTYNLALSLSALRERMDGGKGERLAAQQALLRNSISELRLRELKAKLGNADLVHRPIFHRAQLLSMIKLVARYGDPAGGNRLERRDDFDAIAELGLLVNSLWLFGERSGDAGDIIAPVLAPSIELENPPSVAESLVRSHEMLVRHLPALRTSHRFARHVERAFLFTTGLNFTELIDLTFALWSYYSSLSVEDIVADQRRAHFNPFAPGGIVSGHQMTKLLALVSIPFGEVPGVAREADEPGFLTDFTTLRQQPVWKFGDDNYLCIDPSFVQERLSSGVYWTVMNSLDPEHRDAFSRIWGRAFESHLFETIAASVPVAALHRTPSYIDTGDEAFDAIADFGDRLVVVQAKASFVRADAKYAGVPDRFFEGIDERFGLGVGQALGQIKTNLISCFGLDGRRVVRELRGRRFREVLPVVIYQEPILGFGPVTRHYAKLLERELQGTLFQLDTIVRPVVFIHVDDFHLIGQHLRDGATTLIEILHRKLADDPGHVRSLREFWVEGLREALGLPVKGDELLARRFRELGDAALGRFADGYYL